MNFTSIDNELLNWAKLNMLNLSTQYRDEDVRSFELADSNGNPYQIWIDYKNEAWYVNAWDYKKRKFRCKSNTSIQYTLDVALENVEQWIKDQA